MNKNDVPARLTGMPLFANIPEEQLEETLKELHGSIRHYSKSDYVYLHGDEIQGINMLISGSLQMVSEDFWGNKVIIEGLRPGYIFSEECLGTNIYKSDVSYLVASDSEILYLPTVKETLHSELLQIPLGKVIYNLMCLMADNNARLVRKNEIVCKNSLREKIMTYLSQVAREKASLEFEIPFNRTDFACYLDSDRSSLTRELGRMKKEGLIDFNKKLSA